MDLTGQKFGEFEILEKLGQGGMGTVYKGRQSALRRTVALKTLQAALATDPEYVTRFNNEAVAAAALAHPNLVQVHAAGETGGVHWFAMEYVDGESVQKRLDRQGKLAPTEALAIGMHVVAGLGYGWKKAQLIHRDIKPDNIFLSTEGEVKLGDLGLAKSIAQENSLTMTGASMGTPLYISPEQTEGRRDVTFTTDIYSLGCTLFHLISGSAPYHGETAFAVMLKHVSAPIPDLLAECKECTGAVAAVVRKMMAKTPADRHQSYEELAADLQSAYGSLMEPAQPEPIPVAVTRVAAKPDTLREDALRTAPDKRRRRVLLLTLSCVVTLAAAVGLLKNKLAFPFAAGSKTIDLLALVDPVRDRVAPGNLGKSNRWEKNGSLLKYVSDGKAGKIVPPAAFQASEYRLEIHYKRLDGNGQWHTDIPLRDEKIVPLIFDKAGSKIVHEKGGPSWPADLPKEGKVILHVKLSEGEEPDTLDFDLGDGNVLPTWKGHLKDFSRALEYHGDFPKQPTTSLFSMRDSYEFSKWTVTPIKGSIDVLR